MVSADPCCVAPPPRLDHCIDHSYHGRSTPPPSPHQILSEKAAPTPRNGTSRPRTREIPSRYKSPTPSATEIPSRYRLTPSQNSVSLPSSRRFASPSVDRSILTATSAATPSPKRANSAEPRRPSPIRTSASTSATPSSDAAALPPRRGHTYTRSEILWPSTRSLYSSIQAEPSPPSPATGKPRSDSRNRLNGTLSSDHTLRPSPNSAQPKPVDQRKKTPERKCTPVRRNNLDQSENAKPSESFNVKSDQPLLQHRWPSSLSTLKLYGSAVSKSIDLGDRLANRGSMNLMQARPTSFSSKVIPRASPNSSAALSQSFNDGPICSVFRTAARKLAMDNHKPRQSPRESSSRSRRLASSRDVNLRTSVAFSESEMSVDIVPPSEEDDEAEIASATSTDDTASVETSTFASTSSHSVRSLRGCSVSTPMRSRTPLRTSTSELSGTFTPSVVGRSLSTSRQRIIQSGETKAGTPLPGSLPPSAAAYKLSQQQPPSLSPIKVSVSSRSLPSPTRSRVSALSPSLNRLSTSSTVQTAVDPRKNRKGLSQVEATYLHRILHNRLLQWRFANARADFANNIQRQAAEKLLFSVWARTAEIRKSVTTKRIQLLQARRQQKLNTILRQQGSKLEEWYKIQLEHSTAMSGVVNALDSAVLRVPVNEGVKADVQSVKEAMISAVELVHALESSINRLVPKMERTNALVAELAQVANQERTLLEECGDLLLTVSCFEVEERSLRTQLLQFEQEKNRVLGNLLDENGPTI